MLRRALGAAALALALLAGPAAAAAAAEGAEALAALDQGERYRRLLAEAWGPEPPDRLEKFLACREALKAVYERYPDGITQWALREASTRQTLTQSLMGVFQMRKTLEAELSGPA